MAWLDFIGWHNSVSQRVLGIDLADATHGRSRNVHVGTPLIYVVVPELEFGRSVVPVSMSWRRSGAKSGRFSIALLA